MFGEKENMVENSEKQPISEKRYRNGTSNMLLASQGKNKER